MSSSPHPGPAATRTGAPRAERRAASRALAPLLGASLLLCACKSNLLLSSEDENKLVMHEQNSKVYYDAGDYARAEDQCRKGLAIDPGHSNLRFTLAYTLLVEGDPKKLEEARQILEGEVGLFGTDDWRIYQGLGMAEQQLAHQKTKGPPPPDEKTLAEASEMRRDARAHLEKARDQAGRKATSELHYHLALLDLEDGRTDAFQSDAWAAVELMRGSEKASTELLNRISAEKQRVRAEHDRDVTRERARRLLHESAKLAYDGNDLERAGKAMQVLAEFGPLQRADFFSRARIREKLGEDEGAVSDYEQFVAQSVDTIDDNVRRAIESLTRLRAELAERRTAAHAATR